METLLYVLRVILYTGLCWGIWRLLLRNISAHRRSRMFLWLCALIPLVLPLLQRASSPVPAAGAFQVTLPDAVLSGVGQAHQYMQGYAGIGLALYGLIVVAGMIRMIIRHVRLQRRLNRHLFLLSGGLRVYLNTGFGPGSYGRRIFLPGANSDELILAHETAHVRSHHYVDLLIMQVLKIVFWPNLFLYAIASDLRQVHEYQADAIASRKNTNGYVMQLLNEVLGTQQFSIAHSFFHRPVKQRIRMLQRDPDKAGDRRRLMFAGVMLTAMTTGIVWLQSCNFKKEPATQPLTGKVYTYTDEMPQFDGDIYNWLAANLQYPQSAKDAGKQGRTGIQFVVDAAGNVRDIKVSTSSGDAALDAEAVRAISVMPRWKPGRINGQPVNVSFMLPVSFRLED